jgi:hypothetical protein
MQRTFKLRYPWPSVLAAALTVVSAPLLWGYPGEVQPLHTTASYSKSRSGAAWNSDVLSANGKPAYKLLFRPEYAAGKKIIGLSLVLVDVEGPRGSAGSNLLDPRGNWHGLLARDFMGSDLANGAEKSAFGRHREWKLEDRNLMVKVDISNIKITAVPEGDEIDQLELAVSVDNLRIR